MAQAPPRRGLMVLGAWIQAAVLVILLGFTVLLNLAYRATVDAPPIPARVVDPSGRRPFRAADITGGQEVFRCNGLME